MNPGSAHPVVDPQALAALCRRWGIRELAIFGSALREDFTPESDIDLLVEFEPGTVLGFRRLDLERELSELFGGRRIDLVPRKYLHPRLRDQVQREARVQYAA
jgi:hypothetical protein